MRTRSTRFQSAMSGVRLHVIARVIQRVVSFQREETSSHTRTVMSGRVTDLSEIVVTVATILPAPRTVTFRRFGAPRCVKQTATAMGGRPVACLPNRLVLSRRGGLCPGLRGATFSSSELPDDSVFNSIDVLVGCYGRSRIGGRVRWGVGSCAVQQRLSSPRAEGESAVGARQRWLSYQSRAAALAAMLGSRAASSV